MAIITQRPQACIRPRHTLLEELDAALGLEAGTDVQQHLALAELSVASYLPLAELRAQARVFDWRQVHLVEAGHAQVAVFAHPQVIALAPRGSSEIGDWLDDLLSLIRVRWWGVMPRYVRVGYGFKRQVREVWPALHALLLELLNRYPQARIVLAGHSLGGAMVPLLAARLYAASIDVDFALAAEAPRAGTRAWAAWYPLEIRCPTVRLVVTVRGVADIVTRLPKSSWGFAHVGELAVYTENRILHSEDDWQALRAAEPVGWWQVITRGFRGIRAHLGATMLRRLRYHHRIGGGR